MADSSIIDPSEKTDSVGRFFEAMHDAKLLPDDQFKDISNRWAADNNPETLNTIAHELRKKHLISKAQADKLCDGDANELIIDGKYLLLEFIGKGGMGSVYRCFHIVQEIDVAIKLQNDVEDPKQQKEYVERFRREIVTISKFKSDYIVKARDAGIHQGKRYLVMEYVDGKTFSKIASGGNKISLEQLLTDFSQAGEGIASVHRLGCTHRDIKPGNLIRSHGGEVKVLDFGLAEVRGFDQDPDKTKIEAEELTGKEHIMGTYNYMPYEQMIDTRSVTPKVDVYSLACTLYYMVAHEPPFLRQSLAETITAHQSTPPPSLQKVRPDIPDALEALYLKMMSKAPEDRPTMDHVVSNLREIKHALYLSTNEETASIDPNDLPDADKPPKVNKKVAFGAIAIAVCIAMFAAAAWLPKSWTSSDEIITDVPQGLVTDPIHGKLQDEPPVQTTIPIVLKEPVDLLAQIQLQRDVVRGKDWKLEDGILTTGIGTPADLKISTVPPEEYELEIVVERVEQTVGPFLIGIVAGENGGYLLIDRVQSNGPHKSGLGNVGSKSLLVAHNDTFTLPAQEKVTLLVQVTSSTVTLRSEDEEVISWTGGFDQLRRAANWDAIDPSHLFVGANNNTAFRIHKMELRPLSK